MKKISRLVFALVLSITAQIAAAAPSDIFSILSENADPFIFSSGAGGWSTELHIAADGSFSGYFHDTDMGDTGPNYPKGTRRESRFSGKFVSVKKVSDFEYSMSVAGLRTEGKIGASKIVQGVRVITSEPYGFENADKFILYCPDRKTSDLPSEFIEWMRMPLAWRTTPGTLDVYGLYNVGGEKGFYAFDEGPEGYYEGTMHREEWFHDGRQKTFTCYYVTLDAEQYAKLSDSLGGVEDICDQGDKTEIQVYASDQFPEPRMGDFVGKTVRFQAHDFYEANTIYHRRNIVMDVRTIEAINP
jgi:hypothetical protein